MKISKLLLAPLGALLLGLAGGAVARAGEAAPPASCGAGLAQGVAAALGHAVADTETLRMACKPMPATPATSIVALAYFGEPFSPEDTSGGYYDLDVLLVESAGGKVLVHLHQKGAIVSDAIRFSGLDIDTANYRLAPGVRAFGVLVGHSGSSRIYPYGTSELRLFVEGDGALRQVLGELLAMRDGGEWDGRCKGTMKEVRRTVAVDKPGAHGFADLAVTTRSVTTDNVWRANDCRYIKRAPVSSKAILRYDGRTYPVPQAPVD